MIDGRYVIDAFPFRNEVDLLRLRLRELAPVVDETWVVQARETHAGQPKPLVVNPQDREWEEWWGRLRSLVVDRMPEAKDRWERENAPRHLITEAAHQDRLKPTDLIIISDADEIPRATDLVTMAPYAQGTQWVGFRPHLYQYYLNLRAPQAWSGIALASVEAVQTLGAQFIRSQHKCPPVRVKRGVGGWHFSWLGGVEGIREKVRAFAHEEFDTPFYLDAERLAKRLAERVHPFGKRPGKCWPVPLSELPDEVQQHPDRYRHLFLPVEMAL